MYAFTGASTSLGSTYSERKKTRICGCVKRLPRVGITYKHHHVYIHSSLSHPMLCFLRLLLYAFIKFRPCLPFTPVPLVMLLNKSTSATFTQKPHIKPQKPHIKPILCSRKKRSNCNSEIKSSIMDTNYKPSHHLRAVSYILVRCSSIHPADQRPGMFAAYGRRCNLHFFLTLCPCKASLTP